jgi:hypothetical protein
VKKRYYLESWTGSSVGCKGGCFMQIHTSYSISYLKAKMKEDRRWHCSRCGGYKAHYQITDADGNVIFEKIYGHGEIAKR